jgi:hypothetical protein
MVSLFIAQIVFAACTPLHLGANVPIWHDGDSALQQTITVKPRAFLSNDLKDIIIVARPKGGAGPVVLRKIPLKLRFDARVHVSVQQGGDKYEFKYTVAADKTSQDPIAGISMVISPDWETWVSDEGSGHGPGWVGGVSKFLNARQSEINSPVLGVFASWSVRGFDQLRPSIKPGTSHDGFTIQTKLLPGFTTMYLEGLQWQTDELMAVLDKADTTSLSNFSFAVPVLTMGPMFRPSDTCSSIVDNYLLGLQSLARCPGVRVSQQFVDALSKALRRSEVCPSLGSVAALEMKPGDDFERSILEGLGEVRKALLAKEERQ